jgi:hypothetical protein
VLIERIDWKELSEKIEETVKIEELKAIIQQQFNTVEYQKDMREELSNYHQILYRKY